MRESSTERTIFICTELFQVLNPLSTKTLAGAGEYLMFITFCKILRYDIYFSVLKNVKYLSSSLLFFCFLFSFVLSFLIYLFVYSFLICTQYLFTHNRFRAVKILSNSYLIFLSQKKYSQSVYTFYIFAYGKPARSPSIHFKENKMIYFS